MVRGVQMCTGLSVVLFTSTATPDVEICVRPHIGTCLFLLRNHTVDFSFVRTIRSSQVSFALESSCYRAVCGVELRLFRTQSHCGMRDRVAIPRMYFNMHEVSVVLYTQRSARKILDRILKRSNIKLRMAVIVPGVRRSVQLVFVKLRVQNERDGLHKVPVTSEVRLPLLRRHWVNVLRSCVPSCCNSTTQIFVCLSPYFRHNFRRSL